MEEKEAEIREKIRKAAQMLFFQRHRLPGAKGWELRQALGKRYMEIIDLLNAELDKLGMEVRMVGEDPGRARFFVVLKDSPGGKLSKDRVDDLAVLAACLALIHSRDGKAVRREVEDVLREKFPGWKVRGNIDKYLRMGYLSQEKGVLKIGWRAKAEVSMEKLIAALMK